MVLVSHAGNRCDNNSNYGIWTVKNQQGTVPCTGNDEIYKLIDELPEGIISAVVQGHRHTFSHYFYKGIPIIGTSAGGYYLNSIRLRFTLERNTAYLLKEDFIIEGPIPVCGKVFEGTKRC